MDNFSELEAKEAQHGKKMIEIKVRFWTNNIAPLEGQIIPKNARTGGVVRITRNELHRIKPTKPIPFNSLMEITSAIEKILIQNEIVLHPSRRMNKYLNDDGK